MTDPVDTAPTPDVPQPSDPATDVTPDTCQPPVPAA